MKYIVVYQQAPLGPGKQIKDLCVLADDLCLSWLFFHMKNQWKSMKLNEIQGCMTAPPWGPGKQNKDMSQLVCASWWFVTKMTIIANEKLMKINKIQ